MSSTLDVLISRGQIPDSLRGLLLRAPWDRERLFALDLPVQRMKTEPLVWHLDLPWWREHDRWFVVTPNQVRADPEAHRGQWERTMRVDLDLPIHLRDTPSGLVIMDGIHRLLKAEVEGRKTLNGCVVAASMLEQISVDAPR